MMKSLMRRRPLCLLATLALAAGCGVLVPFVPETITRLFLDGSAGAVGMNLFSAVQVDPRSEDSAGPKIIATGDIDGDGLTDIASGWNISNPIQLHFQRRINGSVSFETITLAGDTPTRFVADMAIADFDGDGRNDLAVLVKHTGFFATCRLTGDAAESEDALDGVIIVYFAPADPNDTTNPLAWEDVPLNLSRAAGAGPENLDAPEEGGYTDLEVADINGDGTPDLVVAWNADECEGPVNVIEYFVNPGPDTARQRSAWADIVMFANSPLVKSLTVFDVDRDGDLDVAFTTPSGGAQNIQWTRNPRIDIPDAFHLTDGTWQTGSVGEVRSGADVLASGDIDGDGITDIVVRSTEGRLIQWFKGPQNPTTTPVRNLPWQVFTIAEFTDRIPEAIALGDLDGDGELELAASAQGAVIWLDPFPGGSVFDQWQERLLIDDTPVDNPRPALTDPNVNPDEVVVSTTLINQLRVVDLDGDGRLDVLSTLDREGQSGLTNDAIIWFRNTLFDDTTGE